MMMSVRQMWRAGRIAVLALVGWLAVYGAAVAQPPAKPQQGETAGGGVYVLAYFLVIFAIALGMLFVCRSSNRRDRAKPEEFVGSQLAKGDDDE